jgi:hypothetical protein
VYIMGYLHTRKWYFDFEMVFAVHALYID